MRIPQLRPEAEIPTAPMADIAFLLIVFFLVTGVFSASRGLELGLSEPDDRRPAQAAEAVFIQIAADGAVTVDCRPMALDAILPYLEPRLRGEPGKPVILYADAGAAYQAMIAVYDVLASATVDRHGFEVKTISVPTRSEVREYIAMFGLNPFESRCAR